MSTTGGIKVFSGNANRALTQEICSNLSCDPGLATTDRFSDGEFNFQITENVRGADVFIVQPTCPPTDAHLMELLVMLDAFRRSSAERVTAVIPYFGYARSDKKDRPRVSISAKLVANLITTAGADRVLTMDLHAGQIQGFFTIPVDHMTALPLFARHFRDLGAIGEDVVSVSPDAGRAKQACVCWVVAAVAYVVFLLVPGFDDRVLQLELGFLFGALVLCAELYWLYRRSLPRA